VAREGVELELGLVADLGRQGHVASDEEVRAALNFVRLDALALFHIAEDARIGLEHESYMRDHGERR
jgi:hypothetical protein